MFALQILTFCLLYPLLCAYSQAQAEGGLERAESATGPPSSSALQTTVSTGSAAAAAAAALVTSPTVVTKRPEQRFQHHTSPFQLSRAQKHLQRPQQQPLPHVTTSLSAASAPDSANASRPLPSVGRLPAQLEIRSDASPVKVYPEAAPQPLQHPSLSTLQRQGAGVNIPQPGQPADRISSSTGIASSSVASSSLALLSASGSVAPLSTSAAANEALFRAQALLQRVSRS
jgi:hypothetical protein